MSYGQPSLQAGDALHIIGFPDLARVSANRLQIQLPNGCLRIEGQGMSLLFRDLLAGALTHVAPGPIARGMHVERIEVTESFAVERKPYLPGECCPVPDDVILLETETSKDYLARSTLTFFGRIGRPNSTFILGFTDRSYRIEATPGQADALSAAVLASRFAPGTANVFTVLSPEYYLPWAEIYRHTVATIEETDHRPQDWASSLFVATLHMGGPVMAPMAVAQSQSPQSKPSSSPEL